jgi:hypothetical protein
MPEMIEQARQVSRKLLSGVRRRKSPAPTMAAQVGNDHAVVGGEALKHVLKHLAGDHQPVHQQEGWADPRSWK